MVKWCAALLFVCTGCSSLGPATVAVNDGRALLEVSHDVIADTCVPAYQRAATVADLARVDGVCLPASTAYETARAAWMAAVAALLAATASGDASAVVAVLPRFYAAAAALAAAVAKVSP